MMTKMKGVDAFERSLKEALETYEVPYNSADWAQLERKLDPKPTTWQASAGLYALLLSGAVAVVSTVYVMMAPEDQGGLAQTAVVVEEPRSVEQNMPVAEEIPRSPKPAQVAAAVSEVGSDEHEEPVLKQPDTPTNNAQVAQLEVKKAATPGGTREATERAIEEKIPAVPNNSTALAIKPSLTEACPGTEIEFQVDNMPEGGIFLWNFGDGSFSNKPTPTHSFAKAGTFEVMLSHSSLGGGNIRNKPAADRIVIHEAPEAAFSYVRQEYENTVPSVHFENRSIGGKKYTWDFGDGTTSSVAHPNHVFKKAGTYQVTLITENGKGCIDRTERTIKIENDYDLFAPKTFSPDGNGVEDTFIPEALKTLGVKFHMSIFDSKSGDLIFETSDPQRPWNGRIGNKGEPCTPGDYVWMVEMKDGDKLGGTYNGNVTLVR